MASPKRAPASKFKASKERKPAPKQTKVVGPALIPNYGDEVWYKQAIFDLLVQEVVNPWFQSKSMGPVQGGDRLSVHFMDLLKKKAFSVAKTMVKKVDKHSSTTTWDAIEALGRETLSVGTVNVTPLLEAQIETNVGLITNLADDVHTKITALYKEFGPDQSKIYPELKEMLGVRSKLISQDQNAKMFTSLNTVRMIEAGLDTFIWDHSSAGKTPRPCHVARDGHEFSLVGGPEELRWPDGSDANSAFNGKRGDEGKPGWAINCRCRQRPAHTLDD